VRGAAPYLFESAHLPAIFSQVVADPAAPLAHEEYFELCLAAHWATVASFCPIDVDRSIRFALWQEALSFDALESMARKVLAAYHWNDFLVTKRRVVSPVSGEQITGHSGEWFSVAVAAYGATRTRAPSLATQIREAIEFEVTREAKVYLELKKARDGVGLLTAASIIALNLAELDRVVEGWKITAGDSLYDFAYRASHAEGAAAARFAGALAEAGRLHKAFLLAENQQYFLLHAPKLLRRSADFLLPVSPFLDAWGRGLASHPFVRPMDLVEVVENLCLAWEQAKGPESCTITSGYPRAVAGILGTLPGGMAGLGKFVSRSTERSLKSGLFHSLVAMPQAHFEEQWATKALHFLKI
jgi:hypothetical protein